MKNIMFILLLVSNFCTAQDYICSLPTQPLVNYKSYSCDNAEQQPVWYVVYDKDIEILFAYTPPALWVAKIPINVPYQGEFFSTITPQPYLKVVFSTDGTEQLITLTGGVLKPKSKSKSK